MILSYTSVSFFEIFQTNKTRSWKFQPTTAGENNEACFCFCGDRDSRCVPQPRVRRSFVRVSEPDQRDPHGSHGCNVLEGSFGRWPPSPRARAWGAGGKLVSVLPPALPPRAR